MVDIGISPIEKPTGARSQKIADAVRMLFNALSKSEQERLLRDFTSALRPIQTPRAGKVLGTIVRLLPRQQEWTVRDVKQQVESEGVDATSKEIYNALGYLTRKGHVQRIGYGQYLVDGVGIVTSDDLGGEPARHEDN